jgi:hypothetical protein
LQQEEYDKKAAEYKAKNIKPEFDPSKPYKVLSKKSDFDVDDWLSIPSVEEAKKCGVSYRTPEKLNYPYIANRWADWIFESRDNEYELIDRVQYEILLFFLYPLPLVLFLFGLRRWLIWMAKD